ncbi:PD-(D/E)XK nuclease family protein [Gardnerella greenwoodii]|uniref:PD-(D/E)XK nuclease family protein n=1 Tax=Gardnerella greenwoodii TaxID=2914925 RepID=UPI0039F1278C
MCEDSALQALFDGTLRNCAGNLTSTLLVCGAPNTGKTQFAVRATIAGYQRWPHSITAMAVQNRNLAASIDNIIIRSIGVSEQSRPVGTLESLAFRIISANCKLQHKPNPKLLNGAEQDALLRKVVRAHIEHVFRGDNGDCDVCQLFQDYFGTPLWVSPLTGSGNDSDASLNSKDSGGSVETGNIETSNDEDSNVETSNAFMHQLRDMLARLDELGINDSSDEQSVLDSLDFAKSTAESENILPTSLLVNRRSTQWRLVFALRSEYRKMLADTYKGSFRLDASELLVEGSKAARSLGEASNVDSSEIPALLVVDDYQDITLAGLSFVETLLNLGTRLVLIANPDESVQTFRGAYPDYAISVALRVFNAAEQTLEYAISSDSSDSSVSSAVTSDSSSNQISAPSMRDLLAARVSLSLTSQLSTTVALPNRPWKMPAFVGAFPLQPLNQLTDQLTDQLTNQTADQPQAKNQENTQNQPQNLQNSQNLQKYLRLDEDGTVNTALYRSQREELDSVIWQMKHSHVKNHRKWSDMALIAHDNSTVRLFGEQLRADGVPVRYSLVTRPLKDEPFVQGLFAFIELAQFAQRCISGNFVSCILGKIQRGKSLKNIAFWIQSRVKCIMESPLASIVRSTRDYGTRDYGARDYNNHSYGDLDFETPSQLKNVESLMRSLASLSAVLDEQKDENNSLSNQNIPLRKLMDSWNEFRSNLNSASNNSSNGDSNVNVVINLDDDTNEDMRTLSLEACYLLCFADVAHCNTDSQQSDSTVLNILQNMAPRNPHVAAFVKIWKNVQTLALKFASRPDLRNAKYALGEAWNVCNVAERWQRTALQHNREGYRANDRLDAAMRLFDYVSSYSDEASYGFEADLQNSSASLDFDDENSALPADISDFIAQVRGMEIEADSLARVAPVPDAVTLTTPAGAAGKHWPLVWMPTLQQRVWPNLASRSTMFGAESLASIMLDSSKRAMSQQLNANATNKLSNSPLFISANLLASNDKSAVFAGEQRSFLLSITRATESLYISAQYSDSAVPSDFLYYYLPERYYNNENSRTPFTDFKIPFAGLDMDVRGLVCAVRAKLVRDAAGKNNCDNANENSGVLDAAKALRLLRESGVDCADCSQWDFMSEITENSSVENSSAESPSVENSSAESPSVENSSAKSNSTVVSLSPSAVDSLWACPVCGLLNRQLAGPQPGSAATYFGTLIHETARWASENKHYDFMNTELEESTVKKVESKEVSVENSLDSQYAAQVSRINEIANRMEEYYESIAPELADIRDAKERYSALSRQSNISRALHTIAQYFVTSFSQETYNFDAKKSDDGVVESLTPSEKSLESSIGSLLEACCEMPTSAHFGFDDIARVLNNTFKVANLQTVSVRDCYELMGALVGGWPDGACEDLQLHIHGRIDRLEKRKNTDGSENIRLLDYKTGKVPPSTGVFNDLQLVCYQLALLFADENPLISASNAPTIARSVLFHVVDNDYPAQDHSVAENLYQPPLCITNALNNQPLESRAGFKNMARLLDCPQLEEIMKTCPNNVSDQAWQSFRCLSETAKWSLTMISRVFYAAAAVRSKQIIAHPTSQHLKYCRAKQVCPACAGRIDTVYEVRQS